MKSLILLSLLAFLSFTATPLSAADEEGLNAEYFNIGSAIEDFPALADNKKPFVQRIDKNISFDSTQEAFPGTTLIDFFYVRWTGKIKIPKDGKYSFFLESDDGSRLFIDAKPVVDNGGLHAMEEKSGDVELKAGQHDIKVEFFENEADAGCKLSWQGPDLAKQIVPARVLSPAKAAAQTKVEEEKPSTGSEPGLAAEYFDMGNALEDFPSIAADKKPAIKRVDKNIQFQSTQEEFPGTKLVDHFYVRWTGKIKVPKEGKYTFYLESDDGSRMSIDGKQVVENGGLHAMEEKSGDIQLKAGNHEIKVEFFENDVDAGCKLSWEGPNLAKEIVPAAVLFH